MNHSHSLWRAEARLLLRSNRNVLALILLLVLSAASVWSGIVQVQDQRATIERVQREQVRDLAAVEEANAGPEGEAGYNAYYAFMLTQDPLPRSLSRRSASVTCNPMFCACVPSACSHSSTIPKSTIRNSLCRVFSIGLSS